MLAVLGMKLLPARWTPPPAIYQQLQQRLAWRDSLIHLRTQIQNQHHALLHEAVVVAAVETRQTTLIADLTEQVAAVERELRELLDSEDTWAASIVRLQEHSRRGLDHGDVAGGGDSELHGLCDGRSGHGGPGVSAASVAIGQQCAGQAAHWAEWESAGPPGAI